MYDFIDTTVPVGSEKLPAEAMSVDGVYIENVINGYRTLYVVGRELLESEIDEYSIASIDGARYRGKRNLPRSITVGYQILSSGPEDFREKYNQLAGILDKEQMKLIFADEPDKYFIGTKSSVGDVTSGAVNVKGEFTIYCTDPRKYATAEKEFPATWTGEALESTIVNNGTEEVTVDYTITHSHENGYVGIVSQHGVIQLGKVEETDGENYKQNEKLATLVSFQSLADDKGTNYMHPQHIMNGSLKWQKINSRNCLLLSSMGSGASGKWSGGMRTLTLPADSEGQRGAKNFYCYLNHWFETGLMGQTAEQSIAFLTSDNKVICGYSLFKSDMSGNTATLEYWANGKIIRSIEFQASNSDRDNPFIESAGHSDIKKEGSKVTFYWWGSYLSYTIPEIRDMECTKIQIAFTQWHSRNTDRDYVTRNYLRAIDFQKMNVEKWKDVPNRFQNGDQIYVNGNTTKIYVNGMERTGDEILGSKYFLAPPGETKVQYSYSSFCDPRPTITAKIREAWL